MLTVRHRRVSNQPDIPAETTLIQPSHWNEAHEVEGLGELAPLLLEVRMRAGLAPLPPGWVRCHGQLLAVQDHPAAAAVVGSTWGGDGVLTFGVPDMRGLFPRGGEEVGGRGGAERVELSAANLPTGIVGSVSGQSIAGTVTVKALNGDAAPVGPTNTPTVTANTLGKSTPANIFYPPGVNQIAVPTSHNLMVTGGQVSLNGAEGEPVEIIPPWCGLDFVIYLGEAEGGQ